ncbi:MAG: hypothetical protein WCA13_02615 [Terriglobales bacterium]
MNKAELVAAISTLDTLIQIFAVLVAIGILGEVGFGVRHWVLNRRLALIQHAEDLNQEQVIAAMNKEAGDARREAGLAMERAGKAEENLGNARKAAAIAEQHAADANARAAGLEVEALQLRKQVVLQGARENLLAGDNRQKLVHALKPFAGQRVDVRYSANAFMVNSAVISATPLGDDTVGLANALVGIMKDAGWSLPPTALLYSIQGYGINVEIVNAASPSTRAAAEELAKALRDVSLVVFGPQIVSPERTARVGKEAQAMSPPLDENTIVLGVLTHPK